MNRIFLALTVQSKPLQNKDDIERIWINKKNFLFGYYFQHDQALRGCL
jgi:hypothetical protein